MPLSYRVKVEPVFLICVPTRGHPTEHFCEKAGTFVVSAARRVKSLARLEPGLNGKE
jgi:hypothetical protein